jgi:hypothetical protein
MAADAPGPGARRRVDAGTYRIVDAPRMIAIAPSM